MKQTADARHVNTRQADVCGLFLHQQPMANRPLHSLLSVTPALTCFAVGPEGGFTDSEAAALTEAGLLPVFLGRSVLRTETAAIYGTAAIRTLLLERESWTLVK
jgi:16S rRNA (uracil1498-N3)-methyltransferase